MEKITIPFSYVISVIATLSTVVATLVVAIGYMFKVFLSKSKETATLTKSFVEVTKDHSAALKENTRVIEELPDKILLAHLKVAK